MHHEVLTYAKLGRAKVIGTLASKFVPRPSIGNSKVNFVVNVHPLVDGNINLRRLDKTSEFSRSNFGEFLVVLAKVMSVATTAGYHQMQDADM